jgi:hypothetical protein
MTTLPHRKDFEYRSKEEINGLPLIHINIGTDPGTGRSRVAKGVVAIGNIAFGVISIGVAAFGVITLATFGLGIVSLASVAIGIIAVGAVALGYEIALGVVIKSAKYALGVMDLNLQFAVWSLILAASIALLIWRQGKIKADRQQSRIEQESNNHSIKEKQSNSQAAFFLISKITPLQYWSKPLRRVVYF